MPKNGENIHKRKDGRWEGRYKKCRDSKGNIIYGYVYGKNYGEVKEKLLIAEGNTESSVCEKNGKQRFEDVLLLWLENNRIHFKGATLYKYQYIIETHILPELGDFEISSVTSTVINTFLSKKLNSGRLNSSGSLSASYVRSMLMIINASLKFAADEQMCPPLKSPIYKPALTKKELQILTLEEQKKLELYLKLNATPTNTGIFISLYTGMRIGEICALKWSDIDLENRIIHIRHTAARVKDPELLSSKNSKWIIDTPKTRSSMRDIPIPSALFSVLCQSCGKEPTGYVVSGSESFVNPRTFEYRYHGVLRECGLCSVNFHALRHTFATRCIQAGVDVKSLSEILGHSNISITLNTYVHSSIDMKRNQLEKLSVLSA